MFSDRRSNKISPYLEQNLSESVVIDRNGPFDQPPDKFIRKALWSPYYGSILGTTTETWFRHGLVKYHLDFYSVSQIIEHQVKVPSGAEKESSNGKLYSWPIFGSLEESYPINDFLWYPAASTSDQGHFFLYAAKNQPIGMKNVEQLAGPCQAQFSTLDAFSEIWHNPTCIALTSDATR